jgi:hypothetical protein
MTNQHQPKAVSKTNKNLVVSDIISLINRLYISKHSDDTYNIDNAYLQNVLQAKNINTLLNLQSTLSETYRHISKLRILGISVELQLYIEWEYSKNRDCIESRQLHTCPIRIISTKNPNFIFDLGLINKGEINLQWRFITHSTVPVNIDNLNLKRQTISCLEDIVGDIQTSIQDLHDLHSINPDNKINLEKFLTMQTTKNTQRPDLIKHIVVCNEKTIEKLSKLLSESDPNQEEAYVDDYNTLNNTMDLAGSMLTLIELKSILGNKVNIDTMNLIFTTTRLIQDMLKIGKSLGSISDNNQWEEIEVLLRILSGTRISTKNSQYYSKIHLLAVKSEKWRWQLNHWELNHSTINTDCTTYYIKEY